MRMGTKDIQPPSGLDEGLVVLVGSGVIVAGLIGDGKPISSWQVEDLIAPLPMLLGSGQARVLPFPAEGVHAVRNTIDRVANEAATAIRAETQRRVGILDAVDAMMKAHGRSSPRE